MKLLIVSDAWHPQVNGVVRTYEYLNAQMEKLGHEVKVIGPSDFSVTFPMPGYAEIRLALTPYPRLKKLIRAFGPDSIHIATEGPLGWAARRYCMRYDQDFTTSYHTQFPDYVAKRLARQGSGLYEMIHRLGIKYVRRFHDPARAVLVATQSLEDILKSWGFKPPMRRLTRGVDLDLFYPGEKTAFSDLKAPVALYVGRVAIEKNLEDFLKMPWQGTKIIVGDGPSMGYLAARYPEARFIGRRTGEDLAACYRSADIFVFPSRTETFGIVLIEALASGLPVAAYDAMGPKDIVTEPFLGALHESDLGRAALLAMDCGDAGERAAYIKRYYTWENAAAQFEKAVFDLPD